MLPLGTLTLDVTRGWWGAALDVGFSGASSRRIDPGSVSAAWQWLSLSARGAWAVTQRLLVELQAGVRGLRLDAVATGYDRVEPRQVLLSFGGVASVGASFTLVGPLAVSVRATGVVKPPERFVITNVGVFDLGALEATVSAGAVVRW
ncbi:MAG: hypothetical protein JNJ54_30120 [Myxococcaceae bacterium]|nr:hypothetical protein [Myxococcaceae bacterium]